MENETITSTVPSELSKILLSFTWIDYSLFSFMFGLSAIIGIYYGCFGNKQATTKDYLHGGKTMKILPIAMSLMASNLSGISLMGVPSEMYMHGTQYSLCMFSAIIMTIIVVNVYLPVFYKLQLNSAYEYFNLRFSPRIRTIASALFVFSSFLHIPIVIYVPALAFNQVTGIDLHIITPIVSFVCIFYTTLGGLKAVVWTDTLQFSVTLLTLGSVLIMGTISVGGVSAVWERAAAGGRLEFFNMNPDPTLRATFWSVVISHIVGWLGWIGCGPSTVQRFMALPTLSDAKASLIILAVGLIVTKGICCFSGLIIYAKYYDCDPLTAGYIKRSDQILPFYVLDVAQQVPGISGLFVAGVFSTALSTLSTYLNSLSGILYTDFIAPFLSKDTSEAKASNIMKTIVVTMGCICVALVFVVEKLGSVLELSFSFGGVTIGSLLGLFTMGMLFPIANEKGAIWGGLSSLLFVGFMIFKTQVHNYRGAIKHAPKPLSTFGCGPEVNITSVFTEVFTSTTPLPVTSADDDEPFWLFKVTFYYYTTIGTVLCIVVGLLVSWITRREDDPPVHPDLLSPFVHRFLSAPKSTIQYTSVDKGLHIISMNEKEKVIENFEASADKTR